MTFGRLFRLVLVTLLGCFGAWNMAMLAQLLADRPDCHNIVTVSWFTCVVMLMAALCFAMEPER